MEQIDDFTDRVIGELESTRQEAGMTVTELIEKSGIRRSTYFRKMRGKTDFTTSDIDAIAKALGVDPFLILRKAASKEGGSRLSINPDALSDDERRRIVLEKLSNGGMGLAAYEDENKEAERDADPDAGA